MSSRLTSGRVKRRAPDDLTADRYDYLGLDQAEPAMGVPSSDGQMVISNTDGTKTFAEPTLQTIADFGATSTTPISVNVTGNVTGTVSSLSNHTTDTLTEGTTNLYFTTQRARDSFTAGTGITIINGEIDVGQQVGPSDNVAFNDLTVNGTFTSNDITSANIEADGNLTVTGNLTVLGNTTTQEADNLAVSDLVITVAAGAEQPSDANGAGLLVDGANATFKYFSIPNHWRVNVGLESPQGFFGDLTGEVFGTTHGLHDGDMQGHIKASGGATVLENGSNGLDSLYYGNIVGQDSTIIVSNDGTLRGSLIGDVTGDVTGNVTGNLTGNVTGQVSDITNFTSDDLTEGTTNKYFSTANIDSTIIGGTGVTVSSGTISIGQDVGTTQNVEFNQVEAAFVGDLTGDVTGGLFGPVYRADGITVLVNPTTATFIGDVDGDVTGNLDGNVSGNVTGNVTGNVAGNVTGNVTGNLIGDVLASNGTTTVVDAGTGTNQDAIFYGNVNVTDGTSTFNNINVNGVILGQTAGTTDGNLRGDVLANDGTKILENGTNGTDATFTGSLLGNVTIGSGTSTFNNVSANTITANGVQIGSVTGQLQGNLIGDVLAADGTKILENGSDGSNAVFTGNLVGQVSSIANFNSDALTEGALNLYFTNARADDRIARADIGDLANVDLNTDAPADGETLIYDADNDKWIPGEGFSSSQFDVEFGNKNTDNLPEGTTNLYYTEARARSEFSVSSSGAGSLSYSPLTGVFSYVGPDPVTAGTGVTITDGQIAIGQAVAIDSDVRFNDVRVDGNLTVNGTTTTVNTETINLADNIIVLNSNATGSASQNAGIEIERGDDVNVQFIWDETNNRWSTGGQVLAANVVGNITGTVSNLSNLTSDNLTEGATNLYYSDTKVQNVVDKTYVDSLNIDADTLDGQQGSYYLNYTNFTNTPENLSDFNDDLNLSSEPLIQFTLGVDGTSNYIFTGPGFPTATNDPDLILVRGLKYIFDNSNNYLAHPFVIREEFDGTSYTDGITVVDGVTTFTVPMNCPSNLVYQCQNHGASMRGNILVLSQGVASLDNLLDVEVGTPLNGQSLVYNAGTGQWTNATAGSPPFVEVTGNTTLVAGGQYFANTTNGAITLTLPASPSIGDQVTIIDAAGTASANNITVARNAQRIQGVSQDLLIDSDRAAFTLVYYNFINGWLFRDN